MRRFAALVQALDDSSDSGEQRAALRGYFAAAPAADAAWALQLLLGARPRPMLSAAQLREAACAAAGIDGWLFDRCLAAASDLAETIAHVLPPALPPPLPTALPPALPPAQRPDAPGLAAWLEQRLPRWRELPPQAQTQHLREAWDELDAAGRFLLVKLVGGGLRLGVGRRRVQQALAEHSGLDARLVALRLAAWPAAGARAGGAAFEQLLEADSAGLLEAAQPCPFLQADVLEAEPAMLQDLLGDAPDWQAEWTFDGLRVQLVRRAGQTWIWTPDDELLTERLPEIVAAARALPDGTVLEGELLVWPPGSAQPAASQTLQQRIGRKTLTQRQRAEAPVVLLGACRASGRARVEPERGRRLGVKRSDTGWSRELYNDACAPFQAQPEGPGRFSAPSVVVGSLWGGSHTPRRRLGWHRNSPRRGPDPKPDRLLAHDLLQHAGVDRRGQPRQIRRAALEALLDGGAIRCSARLDFATWPALAELRQQARDHGAQGLTLGHRDALYGNAPAAAARPGLGSWQWQLEPLRVNAVLVYAQAGSGGGGGAAASRECGFAVWSRPPVDEAEALAVIATLERREPAAPAALRLLSLGRADAALGADAMAAIDRAVRASTLHKFGPVCSLRPSLVFELDFRGLQHSRRHQCGFSLSAPRVLRLRDDKPCWQADALPMLQRLLAGAAGVDGQAAAAENGHAAAAVHGRSAAAAHGRSAAAVKGRTAAAAQGEPR